MSYRLSYPLYLDVSEHKPNHFNSINKLNVYQREGNPSPTTALINLNAFYETMIANTQNTGNNQNSGLFTNKSQDSSLGFANNMHYNSQLNPHQKLSVDNSSKSSFSIEAILGLRNRQNNYLILNEDNRYDFDQTKFRSEYRLPNQMSPKSNEYRKEKNLASVSPDSTAKEHLSRYSQRPKNKTCAVNLLRLQTNINNKRSVDCLITTDTKTSESLAKVDQRLAHNSIPQSKSKRVRTIFTPEQLEKLEAEFERQQYMVGPERLYLASALNLSEAQVKVWFQNRRIKWRKQHLEMEHATLKKSHNTDSFVGQKHTENEMSSTQEFESFKSFENDSDFLCQSPHSVDVLH